LSDELAHRFESAALMTRLQLPLAAATLAIAQRDAARVEQLLEPVRPYDHAPSAEFWPAYLRGVASLDRKAASSAAVEFQSIIDRRGEAPLSPLYALAHLGLARASRLAGDDHKSRAAYEEFLRLWQNADPDLLPLKEARQEYARVQ
jgi:hypothetical protein